MGETTTPSALSKSSSGWKWARSSGDDALAPRVAWPERVAKRFDHVIRGQAQTRDAAFEYAENRRDDAAHRPPLLGSAPVDDHRRRGETARTSRRSDGRARPERYGSAASGQSGQRRRARRVTAPVSDIERRKPFGSGSKQSLVRRDDYHRLLPPVLQR